MAKINNPEILDRLKNGNNKYLESLKNDGDVSPAIRRMTAKNGQKPYAIVIACADSRVIPEAIFSAGIGELFVIRVAGNVLDNHQLGSIEYAAGHLGTKVVLMLGHTRCGAVGATINGGADGFTKYITDEISKAIGSETDSDKAAALNASAGVEMIREAFAEHEELKPDEMDFIGAVYDVETGEVKWLD